MNLNNDKTIIKPIAGSIPMQQFFVSPTGSDGASGTSSIDAFQTIARAQQAVRSLIPGMIGDIIVNLEGGTYWLDQGLEFNQSDSGQNGFNVIYRNYDNLAPVISGGKQVTNWTLGSNGIWHAISPIADFRQLYVNDQRAIRARGSPSMISGADGDGLTVNDPAIGSWNNLQDVEVVFSDGWTMPRIHINAYSNGKLYMQQPDYSAARTKGGTAITNPAWIENAFELLDQPGEWYLNKTNGILYYMPRAGENMSTASVIVPSIQTLVNIQGNSTQKVNNLMFEGISFEYGTWLLPNQYGQGFVDLQANVFDTFNGTTQGYQMSPGNIEVHYAQNIAFLNCTFTHLGAGALDLSAGTNQTNVIGNKFIDISGIAIQIGEVDYPNLDPSNPQVVRDNNILNNYITNCSVEYCGGPGIFTGYVRNVRIEHNTISNLPYDGISVGWGWSAAVTICANNSVKYNKIYGIMDFLADGGGIYTLSTQNGTNVSYNVIFDSGWNGLYFDERTNATTWTYNVLWNCMVTIQDHDRYYEDNISHPFSLNNISNNYADVYPTFAVPEGFDENIAPKQTWGLRPGDANFPDWIVNMSGVEPAYASIVPKDEWHWVYIASSSQMNPIGANLFAPWIVFFGFLYAIGVGIIILVRRRSLNKKVLKEKGDV